MSMLGIGLLIWVAVHLFPSVFPTARQSLVRRLGSPVYQGIFYQAINRYPVAESGFEFFEVAGCRDYIPL